MSGGLYSIATIIKRLEAATARLEDITTAQSRIFADKSGDTSPPTTPPPVPPPPPPVTVPEPVQGSTDAPATPLPPVVAAYDERILNGRVRPWVDLTKSFAANSVIEMAQLTLQQYLNVRKYIHMAASCARPDKETSTNLLNPFTAGIESIMKKKEAGRKEREWYAHMTFIGEGAPLVGWVVNDKPAAYVTDIKDSIDYFGNRLLKEFKEKDPKHLDWVRGFNGIVSELKQFLIEWYPNGVLWNANGIPVEEHQARVSREEAQALAASAPPAPAPPPPPPPPPPAPAAPPAAQPTSGGGIAAVFAELNKGEEITKGLRKVDRSEMTHKNPELRASGVVPASLGSSPAPKKPVKPAKPLALAGKKPAKLSLEGSKWLVEYQENESSLTIEATDRNQSINIYACKSTILVVNGKVNAINLVNCDKTSVLLDSVVSSISITKSPNFQIQVKGTVPTIQVDGTDSGQIYLAESSFNTEITTAKCSAINIHLAVPGEEEGIFEEKPVPEMLKTVIQDGKLVTTVVEHIG
ncbi:hypothetical protein AX16_004198 [Volvariella volvacea WC 439]|nr:hypothetical protein AX16_004198 [Volvariella volvacea WC 439]